MTMQSTPTPRLSHYQLQLEGFEGPLDVLLQLIERQRLDISNLSLVAVTDGFLSYIEQMDNPPPRLLGEFVGIAARLLVLKSRSLLPKQPDVEPEEDVGDLAARLIEYQKVKRLAASMRESQESGWKSFERLSTAPQQNINVILQTPNATALGSLFHRALARQPETPRPAPIRPVVAVAEMARRLLSRALRPGRRYRFMDVLEQSTRHEIVAGFIALLTLWSRRDIDVDQEDLFGDIEFRSVTTAGPADD